MAESEFQEHQNLSQHAVDAATATTKGLLLINGGAAVAVLGFAGNLIDEGLVDPQSVGASVLFYAWGVALSVLTFGFSYATNYCLAASIERGRGWYNAGIANQLIAISCAVASLVLFLLGTYSVKDAIVG